MDTQTLSRDFLTAIASPEPPMPAELAALERLLQIAQGDTGQSRKAADFLLAWWNAGTCGGFDLTTLWSVDTAVTDDMATVFSLIARTRVYPDTQPLAYGDAFRAVIAVWRPELLQN